MKTFYTIFFTLFVLTGCTAEPKPKLETVEKIDIDRYTGTWIEIARYDNSFETGCSGATANYTLNNGTINVLNRCYDEKGKLTGEASGKAYASDSSNSKLKVSFFWPFYGDYQVIMLAHDYHYSVIGEPSRKYLWILSRNATLNDEDKKEILSRLPQFGYDPSKLYWSTFQP